MNSNDQYLIADLRKSDPTLSRQVARYAVRKFKKAKESKPNPTSGIS